MQFERPPPREDHSRCAQGPRGPGGNHQLTQMGVLCCPSTRATAGLTQLKRRHPETGIRNGSMTASNAVRVWSGNKKRPE